MSLLDSVQFYFMHFMPYIYLPENQQDYPSLWVDYPNRHFDPAKAHQLYQRYLSEFVLADNLGYDGLVVNEHHSTAYSLMAACNLLASAISRDTKRAKICTFGSLANLQYPNRVAEEYAILDCLSGGRLEVAFPLGTGMEYWANATAVNPVTARARFRESIDIIVKAWTEEGPFSYDGDFYSYRYLNIWPKPYQKPHPKLWIVGSSPETANLAAEWGFGYSSVLVPAALQAKGFQAFREKTAALGHEASADDLMFSVFCYVAETDEQALREGKEHILWYFNNALRTTQRYHAPPGYLTPDALRTRLDQGLAVKLTGRDRGGVTWEALQPYRAICGSPDTVAEAVARWVEEAGAARMLCHLHLGDMPHWKTVKNLTMFAEEVIPRVRARGAASRNGAAAPAPRMPQGVS